MREAGGNGMTRIIPGYERYMIDVNGVVYDSLTGTVVPQRSNGTVRIRIGSGRNNRRIVKVNTLVNRAYDRKTYEAPAATVISEAGEEFRPVSIAPSYFVSNKGRCYSFATCRFVGKVSNGGRGKKVVLITKPDGTTTTRTIDNLMAIAFCPQIPTEAGEEWAPISDGTKMWISSRGRLWSMVRQQLVKPHDKNGYLVVDIGNKRFLVHRLVAQAFIPNDNLYRTDINHINEDTHDNRVENLEWCTKEENNEAFMRNHGFWYNAYRNPHRKREGASKRSMASLK